MEAASRLASAFLPSPQLLREAPCSVGALQKVGVDAAPALCSKWAQGREAASVWVNARQRHAQDVVRCRRSRLGFQVRAAGVRERSGSILKGEGLRFGIVAARFNDIITKPLLAGALDTFYKYGVKEEDVEVVWVPGSFEIPLVAQLLARSGKYQAILCLGAVVRGATSHYDAVANSTASGIMSAGLNTDVPCIFGVLTCDNMEQAFDRAGGKAGNKGAEAAVTAIEMASLLHHSLH